MGFGVLGTMEGGSWTLRKYDLSSLSASQWMFLRDYRIPAWLFGGPTRGHSADCREAPRKDGAAETAADAREQKDSKPASKIGGASLGAGKGAAAAPEAPRRSSVAKLIPGEAGAPALPPPPVSSEPPVLKMVEGPPRALLPRDRPAATKEARDRARGATQVLGATAEVKDAKPIGASRCFRVKATCRGAADYAYDKFPEAGLDAHAELRVHVHEHSHSADADANSGNIWGPDVE
ncbi:unnamed protein product, partial [Prorocentrum cordatum]